MPDFNPLNDPILLAIRADRQAKIDFADTLLDLAADDELSVVKITSVTKTIRDYMISPNGTVTNAANILRDQVIKIIVRAVFYLVRKIVLKEGK